MTWRTCGGVPTDADAGRRTPDADRQLPFRSRDTGATGNLDRKGNCRRKPVAQRGALLVAELFICGVPGAADPLLELAAVPLFATSAVPSSSVSLMPSACSLCMAFFYFVVAQELLSLLGDVPEPHDVLVGWRRWIRRSRV